MIAPKQVFVAIPWRPITRVYARTSRQRSRKISCRDERKTSILVL